MSKVGFVSEIFGISHNFATIREVAHVSETIGHPYFLIQSREYYFSSQEQAFPSLPTWIQQKPEVQISLMALKVLYEDYQTEINQRNFIFMILFYVVLPEQQRSPSREF